MVVQGRLRHENRDVSNPTHVQAFESLDAPTRPDGRMGCLVPGGAGSIRA
jgi:hypothetical protein